MFPRRDTTFPTANIEYRFIEDNPENKWIYVNDFRILPKSFAMQFADNLNQCEEIAIHDLNSDLWSVSFSGIAYGTSSKCRLRYRLGGEILTFDLLNPGDTYQEYDELGTCELDAAILVWNAYKLGINYARQTIKDFLNRFS